MGLSGSAFLSLSISFKEASRDQFCCTAGELRDNIILISILVVIGRRAEHYPLVLCDLDSRLYTSKKEVGIICIVC